MDISQKKIALVTDWITHWGGAERVFERLIQLFPEADIYTSVYFPDRLEVFEGRNIKTSFIQKIPFLNRRHKLSMLLRPLAFSRFDFSEYDLVISCTSAEAKGIITSKTTKHICYCHTPTRYLWSHSEEYKNFLEFGWLNWLARMIIPPAFSVMQKWDRKAAQRPDIFIANSLNTQERILKYYERESVVVYPFFTAKNTQYNIQNTQKDYFMCLGRVVPYKRFDLAILACNQLKFPLKIFTSTINDEVKRLQVLS
jgi:glycosyltransferase involved in cell wall biosynthesis